MNKIAANPNQNIIRCARCNKFILTEEFDEHNHINVVEGDYEDGYYDGEEDQFYCRKCSVELGKNDPMEMGTYWNPVNNKYVDEDCIRRQYKFSESNETYEEFLADNFCLDSDMTNIKEFK